MSEVRGGTIMQTAVCIADQNGIIQSVNREFMKLFGYARNEVVGKKVNILMGEPYASQHDAYMQAYLASGKAKVLGTSRVVEARHKDGTIFRVRICASRIDSGNKILFIATFEKLEDNVVIVEANDRGEITSVSNNVRNLRAQVLMYKRQDLIGQDIGKLMEGNHATWHSSYVKQYVKLGAQADKSNIVGHIRNFNCKRANDELLPVSLKVEQFKVQDRWMFKGYLTPVTDELEAVVTINAKGIIQSVNEGMTTLTGYSKEELLGMNVKHLATPPHSELHDLYMERYRQTKKAHIVGKGPRQVYMRHCDGSVFLISLQVDEFLSPEGELLFRGIIRRITRKPCIEENDIAKGTIIGMYEVEKTIGKGYFGKVKRCLHKLTGERVAIKTLRRKQYEKLSLPFPPREVALLKALHHPHICQLYDVIDDGDKVYLVQEYVTGGELYDYAHKRDKLNEDEARHFFRQLVAACDGLQYMHRAGVVHRDLKLENCLLDAFGNIKIIDFGLGNFFNSRDMLRTFCGTPAYAAPELWRTQPYRGPEVDIWSLGVMLYLMLYGYLPFSDVNDVLAGNYKLESSISSDAQDLLKRMLELDPDKRIQMPELVNHPWLNKGYKTTAVSDPDLVRHFVLDEEVLQELKNFGMDPEFARKSLEAREHNQITTCYHLLKAKREREERIARGEALTRPPQYPHTSDSEGKKHSCLLI